MDMSTVELVAALRGWAERAYQTCHREYMESPSDAPLTEWAGRMTEHLIDLAGLLSSRLGAERERLAAAVGAADAEVAATGEAFAAADRAVLALGSLGMRRHDAETERLRERQRAKEARMLAAGEAADAAHAALSAFDAAVGKEVGR